MTATPSTVDARCQACLATLKPRGQDHLLRWWDVLDRAQREQLADEIESIPWAILDPVIPTHVLARPEQSALQGLSPAPVHPSVPARGHEQTYEPAIRRGRELIRRGRVAAFTVAGGQGTRLGVDGPKGAVAVTPVGGRTLFQVFAETIRAVRDRYAVRIPWYIMTSPANHEQTLDYLSGRRFFGLPCEDVMVFSQGMLPAFDLWGRVLMDEKHRLALAPDGHGGSLKALVTSGALKDMRARGIDIISYFQVDNPLVKPFDPLFIGLHADTGSEMSTKVARKADDLERVGNVCVHNGRVVVVEYTDFPESCARARNEDGSRRFDAGNLAIHLLNVDLVERLVGTTFQLPFRRAEKAVPYVDEAGRRVQPDRPNAVKLETFVFDALPFAANPLVLEVDRAEEFSPVKNATGVDSLESSKRDQVARACRWLEAAGVSIPRTPDGRPDLTVAISPLFAVDVEDVKAKADRLPRLQRGGAVYIE